MATQFTHGSGNVFADLGLDNPEERLEKADLAIGIGAALGRRGADDRAAARLLGVAEDEVRAIRRGLLDAYDKGTLGRMLASIR